MKLWALVPFIFAPSLLSRLSRTGACPVPSANQKHHHHRSGKSHPRQSLPLPRPRLPHSAQCRRPRACTPAVSSTCYNIAPCGVSSQSGTPVAVPLDSCSDLRQRPAAAFPLELRENVRP